MHNPIFMGALTKIRTRMTNDNSSTFEINKNGLLMIIAISALLAVEVNLAKRSGRVGWLVKTGAGQNMSIQKVVLVQVNGFGSERVQVGTGPGQNGFRVGSGWLVKSFNHV
ncbi:hypothetical protein Hanom_Chr11g00989281 [Helianthus anomalus]